MEGKYSTAGATVDHGCCPVHGEIPWKEVCLLGYVAKTDAGSNGESMPQG